MVIDGSIYIVSRTDQSNVAIIGSIAVAVEQGSPVELLCRWRQDDMFIRWTYSDVMDNSNEISIYTTSLKNTNFTSIDVKHYNHNRSSVLIINATSMDNAGEYRCFSLINGSLRQVTAELTVLTSELRHINLVLVAAEILKSFCLPMLLYAAKVSVPSKTSMNSLNISINKRSNFD